MEYAEMALLRRLEREPDWAQAICDGFVKLRRDFWDPEYVAVVMDRWGGSLTFGDVFSFLQIHAMLCSGRVLRTGIEIGAEPYGDKFAAENNAVLSGLPHPFSGKFRGGAGDDDGYIEWTEPILANGILHGGETREASIEPWRAPLEVGHTKGETTLRHLRMSRSLARWPYESPRIIILHLVQPRPEEQL